MLDLPGTTCNFVNAKNAVVHVKVQTRCGSSGYADTLYYLKKQVKYTIFGGVIGNGPDCPCFCGFELMLANYS